MLIAKHEGGTSMAATSPDCRELAVRSSSGVEVGLYWSKTTNRVSIEVFDHRLDEGFVFEIDGADALDAFNHPYAYAAARGITTAAAAGEALAA
jgi:hypothetical protein